MQVYRLAFSPDGNLLAVGCGGGRIYIYAVTDNKWAQVSNIAYHSTSVRYVPWDSPRLTVTRSIHSASVPLVACCWPQLEAIVLPSGMFHMTPRGHQLPTRHLRDTLTFLVGAPFSATSRLSLLVLLMVLSVFGALLTERKLQLTNVDRYVTLL